MENQILLGNCLDLFKKLDDNSVDLIVTSPPYFLEKSYEKDWDLDQYIFLMDMTFQHCHRVLKPGRYFVVNFGDMFNSGNRFYEAEVPSVYPACMLYFNWGRNCGFDLQATRIWRKQFAKMGIPFVCNNHPRNVFDYEHVWTWRKRNGSKEEVVKDRKLSQRGVLGDNWKSSAGLNKHCASFPIELPDWAIKVYSLEDNDLVLDPFMGSGTTALACIKLGRRYLGFELEPEFCRLAEQRITDLRPACGVEFPKP